jgi:uncharacterized protein
LLRPWPADQDYRGYVSGATPVNPKGTVIVVHGNAGAAWDRTYYSEALEPLGYRVFLYEYPGYGARPGEMSEATFASDLRQTVRDLALHGTPRPIFLWGESLGCSVCATALRDDTALPVAGLILLTPWADLRSVARHHYPMLPAATLLQDEYDSVANLRGWNRNSKPTAVILAGEDEIIPVSQGRRLFDSLRDPKRLWVFPGAGHNTWPMEPGERWWNETMQFVSSEAQQVP